MSDSYEVGVEYTDEVEIWRMIRWCKTNFPKNPSTGKYPWWATQTAGYAVFSFLDGNAAMRFKLVWA